MPARVEEGWVGKRWSTGGGRARHQCLLPFALPSFLLLFVLFFILLAPAPPAAACPVCFGESESDAREDSGTRWAAVLLGGVPYALLGGGALLVVRRRREAEKPGVPEDAG